MKKSNKAAKQQYRKLSPEETAILNKIESDKKQLKALRKAVRQAEVKDRKDARTAEGKEAKVKRDAIRNGRNTARKELAKEFVAFRKDPTKSGNAKMAEAMKEWMKVNVPF